MAAQESAVKGASGEELVSECRGEERGVQHYSIQTAAGGAVSSQASMVQEIQTVAGGGGRRGAPLRSKVVGGSF